MVSFKTLIAVIASIFSIIGTTLGIYFGLKKNNNNNQSSTTTYTTTSSTNLPVSTLNVVAICPIQTTKWYNTNLCSDTGFGIAYYTSGNCFQWHTSTGYNDYLGGCNGYNLTVVQFSDSQCLIEINRFSFIPTSDCFLAPFVNNNYYKMC